MIPIPWPDIRYQDGSLVVPYPDNSEGRIVPMPKNAGSGSRAPGYGGAGMVRTTSIAGRRTSDEYKRWTEEPNHTMIENFFSFKPKYQIDPNLFMDISNKVDKRSRVIIARRLLLEIRRNNRIPNEYEVKELASSHMLRENTYTQVFSAILEIADYFVQIGLLRSNDSELCINEDILIQKLTDITES